MRTVQSGEIETPLKPCLEWSGENHFVRLTVFVRPLKNETKLFSEPDGTLTMNVAAPPTKGKANREIIKWLSKKLRVSSSNVQLIAGFHSNMKTIEISGMTEVEVASTLGIKSSSRG